MIRGAPLAVPWDILDNIALTGVANMGPAGFERVADEREVKEGALLAVELANKEKVCLARSGGDIYAVSGLCTHAEYPMSDGSLEGECVIECGLHGARFDLRDGGVLDGPAEDRLPVYAVQVVDGSIWVGERK